jgi:Na+/H+ antiporter NhaD/arsenite permease-like protein
MFIGNDPIMLLFLSSLTKVVINLKHPRAWVHTRFAIANIATGVLVSSNPTNLVIAGALDIKFIGYMANMIVPKMMTALLLFPFLLYIIFQDESLIPQLIEQLPEEMRERSPVNNDIFFHQGEPKSEDILQNTREEAIKDDIRSVSTPWLNKASAYTGSIVMVASVVILLALNAVYLSKGGNTDFWATLPAAVLMICWDSGSDWFRENRCTGYLSNGEHAKSPQDPKISHDTWNISIMLRKAQTRILARFQASLIPRKTRARLILRPLQQYLLRRSQI